MKQRTLGKTGLQVSELALGGLFVSAFGGEFEQTKLAVQRALELGLNYIDTAPTYANSEEVLGKALEGVTAPLVFSTKLGGRPYPFEPQNKTALRASLLESMRLLNRDYIDVLMIHEPERPGQYDWWSDSERFYGPVVEFLSDAKAEGLIGFTGLGGTTAYEMARIVDTGQFDVVLTAFNYSLLWREAEHSVLPAATAQGMGIVIGSPLQQGSLARRHDEEVRNGAPWLSPPRRAQFRELYKLLDEVDISLPEMGLRFMLSNPAVSCVLTGARSAGEVEANVAAAEKGPLDAGLIRRIDEIAAMVPFRPYEEPFSLPFGGNYKGPGQA